jgi:transposase
MMFWALVEPLVPKTRRDPDRKYRRKPGGGKKATYGDRTYFAGIVYVLRTGIIWNAFPREKIRRAGFVGPPRPLPAWARAGFFEALWRKGLAEYDEFEGIGWNGSPRTGRTLRHPSRGSPSGRTRRTGGKNGSKRHALVDERGVPSPLSSAGRTSRQQADPQGA